MHRERETVRNVFISAIIRKPGCKAGAGQIYPKPFLLRSKVPGCDVLHGKYFITQAVDRQLIEGANGYNPGYTVLININLN